jgi:UDP-N-acetylmuramate: L-alanyl-gamma-D-glutamyl-meso-diaminopimelate ligase
VFYFVILKRTARFTFDILGEMQTETKWVHIIGIAGTATSAVAVMFKDMGWKVTGSDKGFFPPVSTYLEQNGIKIMPGFKAERLSDGEIHPSLVIVQGTKATNPEIAEAQKLQLTLKTYPEVLQEYVLATDSIVVAGTYGKTTITAALVWIFQQANIEVSYLVGGICVDLARSAVAKTSDTKYSVVEGDEYIISAEDRRSKFFLYHPKILVVNALYWEHADVFKTEAEYLANFAGLIAQLPADGLLIANANNKNVVILAGKAPCRVVYYSVEKGKAETEPDWFLNATTTPMATMIRPPKLNKPAEIIPYQKEVIGDFNEENLLAAAVTSCELGVRKERIQEAIGSFHGVKRRLEVVYAKANVMVIDDFGSSPPKAKGTLAALRKDYPAAEITAVFEPNTGNRVREALPLYDNAFKDADEVVLGKFTKLPNGGFSRPDEQVISARIKTAGTKSGFIPDDIVLLDYLREKIGLNPEKLNIICFMGSHSFRGMITELSKSLP